MPLLKQKTDKMLQGFAKLKDFAKKIVNIRNLYSKL